MIDMNNRQAISVLPVIVLKLIRMTSPRLHRAARIQITPLRHGGTWAVRHAGTVVDVDAIALRWCRRNASSLHTIRAGFGEHHYHHLRLLRHLLRRHFHHRED